jgi:hypothetical protein
VQVDNLAVVEIRSAVLERIEQGFRHIVDVAPSAIWRVNVNCYGDWAA